MKPSNAAHPPRYRPPQHCIAAGSSPDRFGAGSSRRPTQCLRHKIQLSPASSLQAPAGGGPPWLSTAMPRRFATPSVIGNRRIPKESGRWRRLFVPPGRRCSTRRSSSATSTRSGIPAYFESVRIERVRRACHATPACVQLYVYVKEKPTIRDDRLHRA